MRKLKLYTKLLNFRLRLLTRLLNKFLSLGCNVFAINKDGNFPIDAFLSSKMADEVVNFEAVNLLADKMVAVLRQNPASVKVDVDEKVKPMLVRSFVRAFNLVFVDKFAAVFDKIVDILKLLDDHSIVSVNAFNDLSSNYSPFVEFCRKYSQQQKVFKSFVTRKTDEHQFLYNEVTFTLIAANE